MIAAVVVLAASTLLALAVVGALLVRDRRRPTKPDPLQPRQRVLVALVDGSSVDGVLWDSHPTGLSLRDARMIERGQVVAADGEVFVPTGQVRFVQLTDGPTEAAA